MQNIKFVYITIAVAALIIGVTIIGINFINETKAKSTNSQSYLTGTFLLLICAIATYLATK